MWQDYKSIVHKYDMTIMHKMTQCSFTLDCPEYTMEFTEQYNHKKLNHLYKEESSYMFFSIPTTEDKYRIKLDLSHENYQKRHKELKIEVLNAYLIYGLVLTLISILFAHYSIRPLKEALKLNDEFVKDILHDFNTPIASLKINFKILQKQFGTSKPIQRSEEAMSSIADLQSNLTYFLANNPLVKEPLELYKLVVQRVGYQQTIFPTITFQTDVPKVKIVLNRDAFVRVIDNLLSNSGKYNVPNGYVKVLYQEGYLTIEDSGIGIQHPNKVFNRFYKETNRGMGIGLNIVKKLCDDLDIPIEVESQIGRGSFFRLDLNKVMFR